MSPIEDAVKDLENEVADRIRAKIGLQLQNSKTLKDNFSKNERKSLKELQFDPSILILPISSVSVCLSLSSLSLSLSLSLYIYIYIYIYI